MAPKPKPEPAKRKKEGGPSVGQYLAQLLRKKEPERAPVGGIAPRLKNIAKNNFRGIIGVLVPLVLLSWQVEKGNHSKTVEIMWKTMFWFLLFQPVHIPATGLIPIFLLPMGGAMSTSLTCQCYMNENIVLYILTGMLILLLNNSGVDRRIALWFICSGDSCQFSAKRLIFKCNSAAFFLSMFSNRLITSSIIIQYMTPVLTQLGTTFGKEANEPDFAKVRYIIINSIQVASGIGSTAILHSSSATILFRAIWAESPPRDKEYPDIFNYLQYSAFAFPVAFLMFIFNFCYHMCLINWCLSHSMSSASKAEARNMLMRHKAELPRRVTLHEKLSVLFTLVSLLIFFFRWNKWVDSWSQFRVSEEHPEIPRIKDATVAAIFVVLLHSIPKGYGFLKFLDAEKKSELPPLKAESGILWWRFVDKNINYGYFFTFGSSIAIMNAARETGLGPIIAEHFGKEFTGRPWDGSLFLVCFVAALLANMTTAVASCGIFLPFVMCMSLDAQIPWPAKVYCGALGVGIASSFGFCFPFLYTPAYFCHTIGKVPIKEMFKYSFISVWICIFTLWGGLLVWAPYLFDPNDMGIIPVDAPGAVTTTTPPP